jgi:hypothetical protein
MADTMKNSTQSEEQRRRRQEDIEWRERQANNQRRNVRALCLLSASNTLHGVRDKEAVKALAMEYFEWTANPRGRSTPGSSSPATA